MNRQPYGTPPRWWAPQLAPWWVRLSRGHRRRALRRKQKIVDVEVSGGEHLRRAVDEGCGVLLTPNHSAHYDSAALYLAADQLNLPLYFMAAWQVFAMSSRFECWAMQRMGCFSIDREGSDKQAFKQAVEIVRERPHPLVIFPEGDVYHTTDRVTPFREGAAAIAISAAKRAERRVVVVPCGIKFWYVDDASQSMMAVTSAIEDRLHLRANDMPLADRVHRIAEAALALKELDYLGRTRSGRLRERVVYLLDAVLSEMEQRHELKQGDAGPPERVKALRQHLIGKIDEAQQQSASDNGELRTLFLEMDDVFFAMQLYSYPGDYLADHPSQERLAETLDKFEEDILDRNLPSVRGRRRVQIRFGEPVEVEGGKRGRGEVAALSEQMRRQVQRLVDELNESLRRPRPGGD